MRKTGDEPIKFRGKDTGLRLRDFWSWGFSDLLDNTLRGSYAEFIVAAALGIDLAEARVNWEPWDLTFRDSLRIEVKSCSYLQAWEQTRPSAIQFSIRPAIRWTATEGWTGEQRRQSDVYVFCLFTEKDPAVADPMRLDSWAFYVLPTRVLDGHCGEQKSISLNSLLKLSPERADFGELRAAVLRCAPCREGGQDDDAGASDGAGKRPD